METAFEKLKQAIQSSVILSCPDYDHGKLYVSTDTSGDAIGETKKSSKVAIFEFK